MSSQWGKVRGWFSVSAHLSLTSSCDSSSYLYFSLLCVWAAAPETPSAQGQEGSPELLIRSLVGGPSAELLLDLERVLCREGGPGGAVKPLLKRLQQESQPFLLFLWTLDAPGPNKTLLLTALR